MAHKKPEIIIDSEGNKRITPYSLSLKNNFKKVIKSYNTYLVKCIEEIKRPMSLMDFYRSYKDLEFSKSALMELYLTHLPTSNSEEYIGKLRLPIILDL